MAELPREDSWHESTHPGVWLSVLSLLGSRTPRVVVLRALDPAAGSTFLAQLVQHCHGPGVVVTIPGPRPGPEVGGRKPSEYRPSWQVLAVADDLAAASEAGIAMGHIASLVRDAAGEPVMEPLWLPPPLLEAFSLVAPDPVPIIALDAWDRIAESYYRGKGPAGNGVPGGNDPDRLLLRAAKLHLRVHLVVVTSRPRPILDTGADLALEAALSEDSPRDVLRVRLLRRPGDDGPPR